MTYSAKNMLSAEWFMGAWARDAEAKWVLAQLLADVRREALEEAAVVADRRMREWGILRSLEATHKKHEAAAIVIEIRALEPSGTARLYTSHFANCPNANAHRKERRP